MYPFCDGPYENFMLGRHPLAYVEPQIYTRGCVGAWERVGYIFNSAESPRDRTMPLFARPVDIARNLFDYHAQDSNGVVIELLFEVKWLNTGDTVDVDGRVGAYEVKLYADFD